MDNIFDEVIDRRGTASAKWDTLPETKAGEPEYIALSTADMDFAVPSVISRALEKVVARRIYGYTTEEAEPRFRDSLCWWMKRRFDLDVSPEEIVVGNGSIDMMNCMVEGFSNVGDGVILQRPVYGSFTRAFEEQCHRKIDSARLIREENFEYSMDFSALERACSDPQNKIFVLCSPHNPVGRVWREDELEQVLDICRRHRVLIISDEIHCDLIRPGQKHIPILSLAHQDDLVIQVGSISKSFNCAGIKSASAIIFNPRLRGQIEAMLPSTLISPFALKAQIAAYSEEGAAWIDALNAYIDENIRLVRSFFAEKMPEVQITDPEGTYLLWFDFNPTGLSDSEIHHLVHEVARVSLTDGLMHDPDGGEGFQRMTTSSPRSMLREACERIVRAFKDYAK
ncbi:MAG: aminotransferase class I/II-fold pyridoxal phosphate-dependent enzyme [Eubacteriales bacterium]|nr:aminotransferase class I/II-fold pyridoxal phosphate-dependent enzyme [Eubacteriales bacterium]